MLYSSSGLHYSFAVKRVFRICGRMRRNSVFKFHKEIKRGEYFFIIAFSHILNILYIEIIITDS